jgi:hypothetical protein
MLGGGYAKAGVLGVRQNGRNLLTTPIKPRAIRLDGSAYDLHRGTTGPGEIE